MAVRQTKRISELTALTSASLDTLVLGVDNGTTYKIELDVFADAVTNRINTLDIQRLNSLESVTSSFETKGRSIISSSAQITTLGFTTSSSDLTSLNTFTSSYNSFSASVHSEILAATNEQSLSHLVATSSFNSYTASISTASLVNRLDDLESHTGSYLTSLNGTISGSSQLTGSYDSRYVLSGSITQTTWDNISGKPSGLVSQSTDLSSINTFTQSIDSRVDTLESFSSSLNSTFATDLEVSIVSSSVAATIGVISQNTGLVSTSSFNQYTASISTASLVTSINNLNTYTASQSTSSLVNRLNAIESVSGSWITESETGSFLISLNGAISSSNQLTQSFDTRYTLSGSVQPLPNGLVSSSIQVLGGSGVISSSAQIDTLFNIDGLISGSSQLTSSFETIGRGIISGAAQLPNGLISGSSQLPTGLISGSSQLTSSYDIRYATSASYLTTLNGAISSSSQLTSSFDNRYTLSGSITAVPSGTISGSSQLTASLDTRYAASGSSVSLPSGLISGSSQLTSSLDLRYLVTGSVTSSILQLNTFTASNANTSLNTFTSSLNIWTSSVATTGSNSFNGNQTITGSLNVSSVAVISSSFTANSSSLTLNSGSNLYLQNNGIAEISGSLRVSGSLALTGSISISSGSIIMPNRPAFRVYGQGGATTAVTVLSGSMTIVDFNQGGWDNTTGTFTAPIAGLYQVNLVCRTNSNSSAQSVQAIVYKNNTTTSPGPNGTALIMIEWAANTTANHMGGSTICKLAVGDTLKAIITVGTASFDGNDNFSVAYIG